MEFCQILRSLRAEKGWRQAELSSRLAALGCGVSPKAVSRWEQGVSEPSIPQFLALCEVYGVRDVLHTFCGRDGPLSALNAAGQRRVREYIRLLAADGEFARAAAPQPVRTLPLYDLPASAGTGLFLDSSEYTILEADESVPLAATFAVRLSGDSMEPRFSDRQIVYVRQQQTLEPGEIGIFVLNGDAYCKQLGGDGAARELLSLNSAYAPIRLTENDALRVLGKVI